MGIRSYATKNPPVQGRRVLTEKANRQARLVEKWSSIPEIGVGMKKLPARTAGGLATLLENQVRHMTSLTETQMASAFNATPENMLRIIRLAYPNSVRDKIFTEFTMETARDSIKYIRPVYSQNGLGDLGNPGQTLDKSSFGPDGPGSGFNSPNDIYPVSSFGANAGDPKATYETTESLYPTETYNLTVTAGTATIPAAIQNFGMVDGYVQVFSTTGQLMGYEARMGGSYPTFVFVPADKYDATTGLPTGKWAVSYTFSNNVFTFSGADAPSIGWVNFRYNSEPDMMGEFLGNVELVLTDYQFKPRPLTLGVSWTYMTELILDVSFKLSAEEMLMDSASQEIKKALDFQAIRIGYYAARSNGMGYVYFDAGAGNGTDDSYIDTAQTITQVIQRIGDRMYNRILRGGVSRIVGGTAAITYLTLHQGFSPAGAQDQIGAYQVGTLNGIPLFKVPNTIIPDNEVLTVWKNDSNEADVAVAFGTLVPFFSTGVLQRRNFYKEAGLAHYGDYQVLQPLYLGLIAIQNIRGLNTITVPTNPPTTYS